MLQIFEMLGRNKTKFQNLIQLRMRSNNAGVDQIKLDLYKNARSYNTV